MIFNPMLLPCQIDCEKDYKATVINGEFGEISPAVLMTNTSLSLR